MLLTRRCNLEANMFESSHFCQALSEGNFIITPEWMMNPKLPYLYVGHPMSSDNGLISQKLLLKSEFYYPLHVAMGVAYSCLKYRALIIT